MIAAITLARDALAVYLILRGATDNQRPATGAISHSSDGFAIEPIARTAGFHHAWTMYRAVMAMAHQGNGFHRLAPAAGAVRDSRSISVGH
ncbi:hypothetical protein D3C76_1722060 [compost metagenome]